MGVISDLQGDQNQMQNVLKAFVFTVVWQSCENSPDNAVLCRTAKKASAQQRIIQRPGTLPAKEKQSTATFCHQPHIRRNSAGVLGVAIMHVMPFFAEVRKIH